MTGQRTVVVTDVTTRPRFLACLTSVIRSVDRSVEVVAVASGSVKLPPKLARRVRQVRVHKGGSVSDVVHTEAVRPALVVVITSDTVVSGDWLTALERAVAPTPHCVGLLGGHDPRVLVFGERVRTTKAQEVHLPEIPGVIVRTSAKADSFEAARSAASEVAGAEPVRIAATLIVKDEEDVLAACLDAVRSEVDEVVVYDTGSTDGTVALAEAHGARVIRGFWDNDFAAARNRALEHATTEWVFTLDADEVLQSIPGALKQRLVGERADLVLVPVVSTSWSQADDGGEHRPARIFRRERAHYSGALHETIVSRSAQPLVVSHLPAPVRLLHSGYQSERMVSKDKRSRNLDIARAQVDALDSTSTDEQAAGAWVNYGRALISAGMPQDGLDAFDVMLGLRANSSQMVQASRVALLTALSLGRLGSYDQWLETAHRYGETSGALALARARLLLHHGDLDGAMLELDEAETSQGPDPWGLPFDTDEAIKVRAMVLSRKGEHGRALELLLELLGRRQEQVPLAALLQATFNAGLSLGELLEVGGPQFLARSLREAVLLPAAQADQWLDTLWQRQPGPAVLVAGSVIAPRLSFDKVLAWSLRLREAGAAHLCPLRTIGSDAERSTIERCLALAVLGDVLGEDDALVMFDEVAADLSDDETAALLGLLADYAPGLAVEQTTSVDAAS